jgi:hypothetical protein
MGGASVLVYEQITLRAFIFVDVGSEEKCMAALRYSRFTVDGDILENGVQMHATAAFGLVAVSLTTRTSTATDKAGASPDPTLKASRRGRS